MHLPLLLTLGTAPALAAPAFGTWRDGGDAVFEQATLPASWADHVRWKVPTPSWSNASPVVVGDLVCAVSEPTTLWCVDADTGAPRWQATHEHRVTVPAAELAAYDAQRAQAAARKEEARQLQAEYSQVRREMRRDPGNSEHARRLEAIGARLSVLGPQVEADAATEAEGDREIVGFTSHDPITDGERIYALFGHGVLAARTPDGRLAWAVWVGKAPGLMRGYHVGTSSTPVLVDDLIVVGHGQLVAYDRRTGKERWRGPEFKDYGTPAVTKVGSTSVVLTPAGELVRASDGKVLQQGLADVWFVGPYAKGDRVFYVGGNVTHQVAGGGPAKATAWRLVEDAPGAVHAEPLWTSDVHAEDRLYTSPTWLDDALWVVDTSGVIWRIAASDGKPTRAGAQRLGPAYPSPIVVGGRLLVGGELGGFVEYAPGDPLTPLRRHDLETLRSTPVPVGDRIYVRSLSHLWCIEGPP